MNHTYCMLVLWIFIFQPFGKHWVIIFKEYANVDINTPLFEGQI